MGEINIKSSTIEKGLDLAKEFIQSVMKPSLDEVGELFADKVKLWRVNNQIRNVEKVKAIIEKEGITTKAINMKVLFPYLDAVGLEEDETLQEMWANLFVNYIDTEKNLTLTVYPEILRQISAIEAKVLDSLFRVGTNNTDKPIDDDYDFPQEVRDNLIRLNLIVDDNSYLSSGAIHKLNLDRKEINIQRILRVYHLTELGLGFILACSRNNNNS